MRLFLAATVMCGCGSSSSTVDALGPPGPCSVDLTGAIASSHACGAPRTTWTSSNDQGSFALGITTGSPALQVTIGFAGEPALGRHYVDTDADVTGSLTLTSDSSMVWTSAGTAGSDTGAFDLSFTDALVTITSGTGKSYRVTGSLAATLVPMAGTGATGTITLAATF